MLRPSLERVSLEQSVWDRRDAAATYEQEEETLRMTRAYQHKRILLSRARLKAEAFLLQN